MARWRTATAVALALAALPVTAAGHTLDELSSVFRQACLDHLPDFAASEAEFRHLGFGGDRLSLQRFTDQKSWMLATVDLGSAGAFVCALAGDLAGDGPTPEFLRAMVSAYAPGQVEIEQGDVHDGQSIATTWDSDGEPVIVGVAYKPTRLLEMIVLVGELTE